MTEVISLEQYTGLYFDLILIMLIVIFNRVLFRWVKYLVAAYYLVVSYFFITVKNKVDQQYDGIIPTPNEYWHKNSEWVNTISLYLYIPILLILIFIHYKLFKKAQNKKEKRSVLFRFFFSIVFFVFLSRMFHLAYGTSPE